MRNIVGFIKMEQDKKLKKLVTLNSPSEHNNATYSD